MRLNLPSLNNICFLLCCLFVGSTLAFAQDNSYNMSDNFVGDCQGILFDSGGSDAPYGNNEFYTFTICPAGNPDLQVGCLQLEPITFDTESNLDILTIYDGADTTSPIIGGYSGNSIAGTINVFSGCATLVFSSDGSVANDGFAIAWSCIEEDCPATPPSVQDCNGAIPVCQTTYFEANSYEGTGNIPNEINSDPSCLGSGEKNDVWYVFTVQQSGNLGFNITPNDMNDDYDWGVYNLTNNVCSDIYNIPELEVSCDYSGLSGITGANDGPDANDQPVIPVQQFETYVLNVSNYSETTSGFTLDFGISTASIFDLEPPTFSSASADIQEGQCSVSEISVSFSENVLNGSATPDDFILTGPNGEVELTNMSSPLYTYPQAYDNTYTFTFDPPLTDAGDYTITLVDEIVDVCDNPATYPAEFTFNLPFEDYSIDLITQECFNDATSNSTIAFQITDSTATPNTTYNVFIDGQLLGQYQANTPITEIIESVGQEIVITAVNSDNGCEEVLSFTALSCPECNPYAGDVNTELENIVCYNQSITIEAENIMAEPGQSLFYALHTSNTSTPGDILAVNQTGTFTSADAIISYDSNDNPEYLYNTPLYISPVVAFTDADGMPMLTDYCTNISAGAPVVFLEEITIELDEKCYYITGDYHVWISFTGGLSGYDPDATFAVTGDYNGIVTAGEEIHVTYPENSTTTYNFEVNSYCDAFVISPDEPFECIKTPIELLRFEGAIQQQGNLLSWATATELNNNYFSIYHSTDGNQFSLLGNVEGAGNSDVEQAYQYSHPTTQAGIHYYYLSQTDFNGNTTTYPTISLRRNTSPKAEFGIVSVNQQTNQLVAQIQFTNEQNQQTSLKLYNINGQQLFTDKVQSTTNNNTYNLYTSQYPAGLYFVEITNGLNSSVAKIVIR